MKKKKFSLILLICVFLLVAACQPAQEPTPGAVTPRKLTIMTHDSFAASEAVIRSFEQEHNASLVFLRSGDAGSALNRAILSKENPLADIFYGADNTFLTRALEEDLFEAYNSPLLEQIPDEFELDQERRALPVDYGDVCINYDRAFFEQKNLPIPSSLEELTLPRYSGMLVVENPATSSPGLAFLLATIVHFGTDGYLGFWEGLLENDVTIANDWETAYYTHFSGSSGRGPQPMVVSYGSSPAAEVIFAETVLPEAPTASIIGPETCFRQIEFVGILRGTKNRALSEAFIDFMLGTDFQEDMPDQMFVFPVNENAKLPQVFEENVQIPEQPAYMAPEEIAQYREEWIMQWNETMLR